MADFTSEPFLLIEEPGFSAVFPEPLFVVERVSLMLFLCQEYPVLQGLGRLVLNG
jgi:hypothetical protein